MNNRLLALVLAAGEGTRFRSDKTKILHPLLGKSMLRLVLDSVFRLKPEKVLLAVGYQREAVIDETAPLDVEYVDQIVKNSTANAIFAANDIFTKLKDKDLLILGGNLPLVR